VDAIRPIYEQEEIEAMVEHAEPEDTIFIKFLLASRFRNQEAQYIFVARHRLPQLSGPGYGFGLR
jgi:hypothetical protein